MDRIILASASPRRKQLLEWAEIPFEIIPSEDAEHIPTGLLLSEVPVFLASRKAAGVRKRTEDDRIILAADTIVLVDQEILGKPESREDAVRMLSLLSGRKHQVITGVALTSIKEEILFSETTVVRFHPLSMADIEYYIDHYKPFDKAGGYAIQEWIGVVGIQSIIGDFYNVMGLPVSRVINELKYLIK
jgi:septum formation protein